MRSATLRGFGESPHGRWTNALVRRRGRNWTRRGGRSHAGSAYRHLPGRFRYIAAALHALAGYEPLGVQVDFPASDIPSFEAKVLLAAVLNSPTTAPEVRLAPGAAVDDGLLHVVFVEELSKLGVLTLLRASWGAASFALPT